MKKRTIALVTGGFSGEAVISYRTARTIHENLDRNRYEIFMIDITQEGWYYVDDDGRYPVNKDDFSLNLPGNRIVRFDVAFIAIHGTPGEDGKLQGYFDLLKIPYTSCDTACSALTFNKRYTTAVAAAAGIPVARSVMLIRNKLEGLDEAIRLKFPVFVKPNNGGSSIGMSKVTDAGIPLQQAIHRAFAEDEQVLIEEMIKGREFTVGVYRSSGNVLVLPITEVISKKDFFDYEAKYEGASTEVTPADLDDEIAQNIREKAAKIYRVFNCSGVVRIDFILEEVTNEPYMLEINTIPGQSEASIVPQQVVAMGMTLKSFYSQLIEQSLARRK